MKYFPNNVYLNISGEKMHINIKSIIAFNFPNELLRGIGPEGVKRVI